MNPNEPYRSNIKPRPLEAGLYRLTFRSRHDEPKILAQPIVAAEVVAAPDRYQAYRDFTVEELNGGRGELLFAVPVQLSADGNNAPLFNIRFHPLGNVKLTISHV